MQHLELAALIWTNAIPSSISAAYSLIAQILSVPIIATVPSPDTNRRQMVTIARISMNATRFHALISTLVPTAIRISEPALTCLETILASARKDTMEQLAVITLALKLTNAALESHPAR